MAVVLWYSLDAETWHTLHKACPAHVSKIKLVIRSLAVANEDHFKICQERTTFPDSEFGPAEGQTGSYLPWQGTVGALGLSGMRLPLSSLLAPSQ